MTERRIGLAARTAIGAAALAAGLLGGQGAPRAQAGRGELPRACGANSPRASGERRLRPSGVMVTRS